ncbi:MAG: S-layer homology domain-containing protein [Chloroflexota bacterium]|nr:S-layer homology domain-containing protein [Chloroflexota bacterium]
MQQTRLRAAIVGVTLALVTVVTAAGPARQAAPNAAASAPPPQTQTVRRTTDILVVQVPFHSVAERDRLATEWGAEEVATGGGFLTFWTDHAGYAAMQAAGLTPTIDEVTTHQANNPFLFGQDGPDTFYGGYRTVEEMQSFLDNRVATYPNLAVKVDIGDSWCKTHPGTCTIPAPAWNGYDLFVLHITNQAIAGPKPVFWYDAGIHSREIATPETAMLYINWLLDGYGTNADATWLVDHEDIWVMPMLNPDGHHVVEAGGNSPYTQRKNQDHNATCTYPPNDSSQIGIDLNRNFSFQWACCGGSSASNCNLTYHGPSAGSEEESQAVMNKIRSLIPDQRGPNPTDAAPLTTSGIYQNMHTYAGLNLFPWGWQTNGSYGGTGISPNDADMRNIGAHMAATNAGGNGYSTGRPPELLYAVDGDTTTWAYGELGIPSYTTELRGTSGGFFPPFSDVNTLWNENKGMLIHLAKLARQPYLLTHGPDANTVTSTPMTVTQGTPATLNASINYAWTSNSFAQNVGAAEYYVDTPPWAGGTAIALTGTFTSQTVAVSGSVDTTALAPGRHILFVRGRGVAGYSGNLTWGPISAVFLDVTTGAGTPTVTPTTAPPTLTATIVPNTITTTPTTVPNTATATTVANTATATATVPPASTATATSVAATATATVPPGSTATATSSAATATATLPPGSTATATSVAATTTVPPASTATATSVAATATLPPSVTRTPAVTATACPVHFTDVTDPTAYYYQGVYYLACRGVVSGYSDGTFKPFNNTTRAQMTKIVTLAFNITLVPPPATATFADVDSTSVFYQLIETAAAHNIVSGYSCGGVNPQTGTAEPCDSTRRPYFRPSSFVTRGQLTKIVVIGAAWTLQNPATPTFSDVLPSNVFYPFIETAVCHGVISGYSDNTFRSGANAFRSQIAKIVYLAVTTTATCNAR